MYRRWMSGMLAVLIALTGWSSTTHADEPVVNPACNLYGTELPGPGFWTAVWNFNSPEYCLITTSLPESPNQQPVTTYQVITCTVHGSIVWADTFAIFPGKGYLACPFTPPQTTSYVDYDHFWLYAQTSIFSDSSANPIFHHPDIQLSQPRVGPGLSVLNWNYRRNNNQLVSGSSAQFRHSGDDRLRAETCLANSAHCLEGTTGSYAQFATINKTVMPGEAAAGAVRLNTSPSTIYIGYDPVAGATFQGLLGMLVIDPPYGKDPEPDALPSPQ